MEQSEVKTVLISAWKHKSGDARYLKQVVIKRPAGKKVNGKPAFTSQTRHIPV